MNLNYILSQLPEGVAAFHVTNMSHRVQSILNAKRRSLQVAEIFAQTGQDKYIKYAERILDCAPFLRVDSFFDRDAGFITSIRDAKWCRVAQCPVCIAAKTSKRRSLLFQSLPKFQSDYPNCKFIFLTLTQRHVPLSNLRNQIDLMSKGWKLLAQCKEFPGLAYLKSVEVTRSKTEVSGEIMVHPHSHCVIAVSSDYFAGRTYLTQARWQQLWRRSMKLDYDPIVDVRRAYSKRGSGDSSVQVVMEAVKYITKFDDLLSFGEALPQFSEQVHCIKPFTSGGLFKKYVAQSKLDRIETSVTHGDEQEVLPDFSSDLVWDDLRNNYKNSKTGFYLGPRVVSRSTTDEELCQWEEQWSRYLQYDSEAVT